MTGSGLMDFLISIAGLGIVVGLFFMAIDYISQDERFRKIARYAVGGAALIVFLVAIKSVFFGGGGGGISVTPAGVIEFAISLIIILAVLYLIYLVIDWFIPDGPPEQVPPFKGPLKFIIGAIALVALLVVAGKVLTGGTLGMWTLGGGRHSDLLLTLLT